MHTTSHSALLKTVQTWKLKCAAMSDQRRMCMCVKYGNFPLLGFVVFVLLNLQMTLA